ncbi:MAG TPA: NUDIX hydrolase [Kineosporiaceae bacterium]
MTSDLPLYERDPVAWQAHLAEGNAKQARKRVSADALLLDEHDRVLLVNPNYKPGWDLPGGMAEANEPPHRAVEREVREELGLVIAVGNLVCLDWVAPHGPWDDLLAFVFDAGRLDATQIAGIRLIDGELTEAAFHAPAEAYERLRPHVARRLAAALAARVRGRTCYLQNGDPVDGSTAASA